MVEYSPFTVPTRVRFPAWAFLWYCICIPSVGRCVPVRTQNAHLVHFAIRSRKCVGSNPDVDFFCREIISAEMTNIGAFLAHLLIVMLNFKCNVHIRIVLCNLVFYHVMPCHATTHHAMSYQAMQLHIYVVWCREDYTLSESWCR